MEFRNIRILPCKVEADATPFPGLVHCIGQVSMLGALVFHFDVCRSPGPCTHLHLRDLHSWLLSPY